MPTDFAQLANEVLRRCRQLATYSEDPTCLTRTFLSPPMAEVHRALGEWMQTLGMSTRVDAMGNFVGRREGASSKRTLLLGSHLDTVPNAGAFDGVLGVLVALAAVKTLEETPLPFAVDVIGFSEEEGVRFAKPYLGSRAIAGSFDLALLTRQDARQISLQQALLDFGLDPAQIAAAAYHAEEVVGFLEAHLEQGPILESLGVPVGLVEGIVGQSRLRVRFVGAAGHAGTTPMEARRDALVPAATWIQAIQRYAVECPGLRATVGSVHVVPNAPNVIAGEVELSLDVRHAADETREQALAHLLASARQIAVTHRVEFQLIEQTSQGSTAVDERLKKSLADSIEDCGHRLIALPSGAGHDAVVMAEKFPMAMLFIRHPGGVSHHPDERVEASDVAVAIEVVSKFISRVSREFAE